jgi:hypothetical protein
LIKGKNEEFKHFITFEYYSQDHLTRKGHLIGGKANKLLHQRNTDHHVMMIGLAKKIVKKIATENIGIVIGLQCTM